MFRPQKPKVELNPDGTIKSFSSLIEQPSPPPLMGAPLYAAGLRDLIKRGTIVAVYGPHRRAERIDPLRD